MNIRQFAKKNIDPGMIDRLVKVKKNIIAAKSGLTGKTGRIEFCDDRAYDLYQVRDKNVFFGYYDLQQSDEAGEKLLAHVVKRNADPSGDPAELVWFDKGGSTVHPIAETNAWCWQQGARLRWHPAEKNTVLYNDCEQNRYVMKKKSIYGGEGETVSRALYDITGDGRIGLSLNFSRLQRLRPGYGYSNLRDAALMERAPQNDGVIRVDMNGGEEKLLYSLAELAKDIDGGAMHYINHICISPYGRQFTFFHLWTKGAGNPWDMRFYVSGLDGENLRLLEDKLRISHYCWLDENSMIATTVEGFYYLYDTKGGKKKRIESSYLTKDGHPGILEHGFLADTYPRRNIMQDVFVSDIQGKNEKRILSVYADPRLYGEHRCDLHPRVSRSNYVTIDTTVNGGVRCIMGFQLKDSESRGKYETKD